MPLIAVFQSIILASETHIRIRLGCAMGNYGIVPDLNYWLPVDNEVQTA